MHFQNAFENYSFVFFVFFALFVPFVLPGKVPRSNRVVCS